MIGLYHIAVNPLERVLQISFDAAGPLEAFIMAMFSPIAVTKTAFGRAAQSATSGVAFQAEKVMRRRWFAIGDFSKRLASPEGLQLLQ
jgi:hypothetical protein